MSQLTVNKLGPEAMVDNPSRTDVADYVSGFREFKPVQPRDDWRVVAVKVAGALVAVIVLWTLFGVWKTAYCWDGAHYETCQQIDAAEPVAVLLLFASVAGIAAWRVVASTAADLRQKRAYAARTALVLDRFGNQVPADLYERMDPRAMVGYLERRYQTDVALKAHTAPSEIYWGVNSLSQQSAPAPVAELPAPAGINVGPVPADEWLRWLDEPPHLLLAAESGGGKSVLASVVLDRRVTATSDAVAILDPHWSPLVEADEGETVPKWAGIAPLATTHREIRLALKQLRAEYDRRMEQLRNGEVLEKHFPWLTIIIDEVPEVVAELKKLDAKGEDTWADTAEVLGSGARKVNIRCILLSQSALVEDVGMNGSMRKNFYRVALSHQEAGTLLKGANQTKERLDAVQAKLDGASYPAVVLRKGVAYVLDRSVLLEMMPETIGAEAWRPGSACSSARSSETEGNEILLEGLLSEDGRTDGRDETFSFLVKCAAAGMSRDSAFKTARATGHQFSNGEYEWAEVKRLAGK